MRRTLSLLLLVGVAGPALAQDPSGHGPYKVGLRLSAYATPETQGIFGAVYGRTRYPALFDGLDAPPDTSGGPYPHVAFLHGLPVDMTSYKLISSQMASWGFIVTGVETNVSIIEPSIVQNIAKDQELFMDFIEADVLSPGEFFDDFAGMFDGGDWGVVGHSFGASAVFFFLDESPRCRVGISLHPYLGPLYGGSFPSNCNIDQFTGSLMVYAGDADTDTPWQTSNYPWYQAAVSAGRRFFPLIQGASHFGAGDVVHQGDPMTGEKQDECTYLFTTGFLRTELKGEMGVYDWMLGEAAFAEPWTVESDGTEPTVWAVDSTTQPNTMLTGIAGGYGNLTYLALSPVTASIPSAFGLIQIDPLQAELPWIGNLDANYGTHLEFHPILPGASGTTSFIQALMLDGIGGAVGNMVPYTAP